LVVVNDGCSALVGNAVGAGAVVGVLPALAVASGVILGPQVAVVCVVDIITGFMDPTPQIPPISPIGITASLLNGGDVKAAKELETLFSIGKLATKSAQGIDYALEAIKTGLE